MTGASHQKGLQHKEDQCSTVFLLYKWPFSNNDRCFPSERPPVVFPTVQMSKEFLHRQFSNNDRCFPSERPLGQQRPVLYSFPIVQMASRSNNFLLFCLSITLYVYRLKMRYYGSRLKPTTDGYESLKTDRGRTEKNRKDKLKRKLRQSRLSYVSLKMITTMTKASLLRFSLLGVASALV